ncbi:hypothetical protein MMC08_004611 [Hypocenomyce scalaris]|nr:hypothetical protein [Hypocenomyce scalaris]
MTTDPKYDALHKGLFDEGVKVRRAVLGDAYVDKALANGSSEYSKPGQELVTEWAWGNIWTRPGLERKQRSLINLAFLIALKSWPELALHTRGALRNGLTETEIREVVLQAKVYCGVPCGVEAMKVTEKAINDMIESGEHKRELKEKG